MKIEEIILKIKEIIKIKIRPILVMDGGNVEFVSFEDNILTVRLLGACSGCPLSNITLKGTIERLINEELQANIVVQALDFENDDSENI